MWRFINKLKTFRGRTSLSKVGDVMSKKTILVFVALMLCCVTGILLTKDRANGISVNESTIDTISRVITQNYAADDIISTADNIIDNQAVFGYDISLPYDWSCEGIASRSVCYRMHGFIFLDYVYYAWTLSGDEKYKDYIEKWIIDWVHNNPTILVGNDWAWHDDATARRLYRMSLYVYLWQNDFTESDLKIILASLKDQAQLLADDSFYKHKHNHGMYQDMGLITYAILFADSKEREEYLSVAQKRSEEYFNYCFTEDGVHKEHSPQYHIYVSQELLFYRDVFKDYNLDFSNYIEDLRSKSSLFTTEIVMPDGTIPSIGDSTRKVLDNIACKDDPYYLYVTTDGVEDIMPPSDYVFPSSGYAIMRSSWADGSEKATYLLFTAATFSSAHKHSDDLSFILYHKGDLFVEGGNRNFNYSEPKTKYTYSSYAHNVLLVNGEGFPVHIGESGFQSITENALDTHIIDYDLSSDDKWVKAVQNRFDNVTQYRTVSYNKLRNTVEINDELDVTEDVKSTLIYHITADVKIMPTNDGWKLYRGKDLVADVEVRGAHAELQTISGSEGEYPLNTWIFDGKENPQIGSLLIINVDCMTGKNHINLIITLY